MSFDGRVVAWLAGMCGLGYAVCLASACSQPRACSDPEDCFRGQVCADGICAEASTPGAPDANKTADDGETPPPRDTDGSEGDSDPSDIGGDGDHVYIDVAAGDRHSCGLLDDGRVICWGSPDTVVERAPRDRRFKEIAGGWDTTCGRTRSDELVCWGWREGEVPTADGALPSALHKDAVFDVSTGVNTKYHAQVCVQPAVDARRVNCYVAGEDNDFSVTGQGKLHDVAGGEEFACISFESGIKCNSDFTSPPSGHSDFETPGDPADLACSKTKCCAVGPDGTMDCFGTQTDFGDEFDPPDDKFDMLTVGYDYVCGRKRSDKTLECWGDRNDETIEQHDKVSQPIQALAGGRSHVCALLQDGFITCWGNDFNGRLDAPSPNQAARMLNSK